MQHKIKVHALNRQKKSLYASTNLEHYEKPRYKGNKISQEEYSPFSLGK